MRSLKPYCYYYYYYYYYYVGAKSKFGKHKELIALTFYIVKYKYSVNQLRDISGVHSMKNSRLFTNWWPV